MHDGLEHIGDAAAGLGRDFERVMGVEPDHLLDLLAHPVRLRGREVDLVEDGNHLVIVVERLIDVGERLRLDALGSVDDEERALAGGEAAVDFIGEVDVARGVDQVQLVKLAVLGPIVEPHRLRLDGDAALALDVHGIEHLLLHLARGESTAKLNQPVGEGRFAVVDVSDDGEVSDMGEGSSLGTTHGRLGRERRFHGQAERGAASLPSSSVQRGGSPGALVTLGATRH